LPQEQSECEDRQQQHILVVEHHEAIGEGSVKSVQPPEACLVTQSRLLGIAGDLLARSGSEPNEADIVARHLVDSDLVGYHSHGVRLLPVYMRTLEAGWLKPNATLTLLSDEGSLLAFDGGLGYGRRVVGAALDAAVSRCRSLGISIFSVANAHHIGRAGAYGEIAAEAGLISIYFCNSVGHEPLVAAFGGRNARFSTNPMCFAIPTPCENEYFLLDVASSRTSYFKTLDLAAQGKAAPEGMLLDAQGRPTTDPHVLMGQPRGALLPFGDHKGYGLAVFSELLAIALSGGRSICTHPARDVSITNIVGILVDPSRFPGSERYTEEARTFLDYIRASTPSDDDRPVVIPGERLRAARRRGLRDGINLAKHTIDALIDEGSRFGLNLSIDDFRDR